MVPRTPIHNQWAALDQQQHHQPTALDPSMIPRLPLPPPSPATHRALSSQCLLQELNYSDPLALIIHSRYT